MRIFSYCMCSHVPGSGSSVFGAFAFGMAFMLSVVETRMHAKKARITNLIRRRGKNTKRALPRLYSIRTRKTRIPGPGKTFVSSPIFTRVCVVCCGCGVGGWGLVYCVQCYLS